MLVLPGVDSKASGKNTDAPPDQRNCRRQSSTSLSTRRRACSTEQYAAVPNIEVLGQYAKSRLTSCRSRTIAASSSSPSTFCLNGRPLPRRLVHQGLDFGVPFFCQLCQVGELVGIIAVEKEPELGFDKSLTKYRFVSLSMAAGDGPGYGKRALAAWRRGGGASLYTEISV